MIMRKFSSRIALLALIPKITRLEGLYFNRSPEPPLALLPGPITEPGNPFCPLLSALTTCKKEIPDKVGTVIPKINKMITKLASNILIEFSA